MLQCYIEYVISNIIILFIYFFYLFIFLFYFFFYLFIFLCVCVWGGGGGGRGRGECVKYNISAVNIHKFCFYSSPFWLCQKTRYGSRILISFH